MTNLAFDTHKFVKDLTIAKMPQAQAEALAYHYASLLDDRLATKDDIKLLKSDIKLLASKVEKDNTQLASKVEKDNTQLANKIEQLASKVEKDNAQLANKIEQLESNVGKDIKQLASDGKNNIELAARGLWIKMLVAQFGMTGLIIGALGFLS